MACPCLRLSVKRNIFLNWKKLFFSFTYGGECLSLAAASACIRKIKRENVINHLWQVGQVLKDGYNDLARKYRLEDFTQCIGYPCRTIITFNGQEKYDEQEMKTYFQQELLRRGILWAAYHALAYSHKLKEIEFALNVYDAVLKLFREVMDKNLNLQSLLEGEVVKPVFRKVADFMSYTVKK